MGEACEADIWHCIGSMHAFLVFSSYGPELRTTKSDRQVESIATAICIVVEHLIVDHHIERATSLIPILYLASSPQFTDSGRIDLAIGARIRSDQSSEGQNAEQ